MFISIKKYAQIIKAIATLASRPYLARIVDNADGTITFIFVQDDKTYSYTCVHDERILN